MKASGSPGRTGLALCCSALLWGCALPHEMVPISPCGPGAESREIRWYGPSEPRDRVSNEERCRTAGPPVVMESPTAPFKPLNPGDGLAVFSWNMAVGGGDLRSFLEEEVGLTCLGPETRPSDAFPDFVLLLQEAFRRSEDLPPLDDPRLTARKSVHDPHPGGDPDVLEVAALCGLAALYVPSGRNGIDAPGERRLDKGNAILSTLPLYDFIAVENPFETERKVAVAASVQLPNPAALRLVSAHMEVTSTLHRVLLSGNQTRARQAAGLIEALDAHEREEGRRPPTLVGGDFNTWSGGESALKLMRLAFPDSPAWDGQATRGPFPTDQIFFRRGSDGPDSAGELITLVTDSYRPVLRRYSSDHQARFIGLMIVGETMGTRRRSVRPAISDGFLPTGGGAPR